MPVVTDAVCEAREALLNKSISFQEKVLEKHDGDVDLLKETSIKMGCILENHDKRLLENDKRYENHEQRISNFEKRPGEYWKSFVAVFIAALGGILATKLWAVFFP